MSINMPSNHFRSTKNSRNREGGFSLLEMVVAMLVLTIGLLGVASAVGYALMASNRGRGVTNSKMLVVSTLEQMEMLRDTGQLNFLEISNTQVAGSTFTGFSTGWRDVSTIPGPDGIFGTADDLFSPGPDGYYGSADDGTAPDLSLARPNVQRMIEITPLPAGSTNPLLKKIKVTLRLSGDSKKDVVGISYLNDDAHSNYIP